MKQRGVRRNHRAPPAKERYGHEHRHDGAQRPPSRLTLKGKVSLITGSTSGIGLGIARALAGAGSAVVLNGFGKPEEIEAAQERRRQGFRRSVAYSAADMSSPARSPR